MCQIVVNAASTAVCRVYLVIMAANDSNAEAEISRVKDKFGHDCHVICNVGDFSHVVSISYSKWSVKVKFQITGINQPSPVM